MKKGEKFNYFWLESSNVIRNLKQPIIEHHIGHQIYIATFEHGMSPLTGVQKARGGAFQKAILVSPPLNQSMEISFDFVHTADLYISKEPLKFPKDLEVYGDGPGFTLGSPEYLYKDLVPTWEGVQHWLFPLQEKFWQDLMQINPETYLSHGIDYDVIVSKNKDFIALVEKSCKEDRIIYMRTTRFAAVIRAFWGKYPDAIVKIDHKVETRPIDEWCTKKNLRCRIDFSISFNNIKILSFHDDSTELWAPIHELPLVKELASKRIVRYQVCKH